MMEFLQRAENQAGKICVKPEYLWEKNVDIKPSAVVVFQKLKYNQQLTKAYERVSGREIWAINK